MSEAPGEKLRRAILGPGEADRSSALLFSLLRGSEKDAIRHMRQWRTIRREMIKELLGFRRLGAGRPRLDETREFWQEAFRLAWAIDALGLPKADAFRVVTKTKTKRGLSASDYRWLNIRLAKARQALSEETEAAWPGDAGKALRTLPLETRIALAR